MNNDFTVDNFCNAISSSRPTIYRMIKAGELFAYKVRNSTRIPYTELARIQNENQIKPTRTNHTEGCDL
jgi:excisionase family DNA binding protein